MSLSLQGILPALGFLETVVQDNTLAREFYDALFPELLYRAEATPERWEANLGERMIFTRSSLLKPTVKPLEPGFDPTPKSPAYEQWEVVASQYGDSIDTNMPASRTALASLFARNAKTLGLNAGQTLNRLARDKLFAAYIGGATVTTAPGVATVDVPVASLNGFGTVIVNGQVVPVSTANPKAATISGVVPPDVLIIGVVPDNPNEPHGPGTLTLAAPVTFAAGAVVTSADAPTIIRSGGGTSVDSLVSTDGLTVQDIREAVATLRRNRVPPHEDGYYHCHLDPVAESQIFSDNEFQRLLQSLPDDFRYQRFAIGRLANCVFYSNNESPNPENTGVLINTRGDAQTSPSLGGEVVNGAGVSIIRTILTGGGAIMEKWIDETAEYSSEAGYQGKVGAFSVVNNGIVVPIERTRYIIRAPQDRLQQIVSQSWSASLDFGIPADLLGGLTDARFKRAVVIESGSAL